jgi:LacI family transcriptional regulator
MENADSVCTMRTLSRVLGLSVMTVSRALRNATGVSPQTRARVIRAAKRHGYRPDPSLAVLNAYRNQLRQRTPDELLAFVTDFPKPDGWKCSLTFRRYFEGASARAQQLGYRLEPFWIGDPMLTPRRASQILRERGVRGIIVGPLNRGSTVLHLDWERFSSVSLGRSLAHPGLTAVSTNHQQAVELAVNEARLRGYRRIGLAITRGEDIRVAGSIRAAFLLLRAKIPDALLPILMTADFSRRELVAWVDEYRPDLIISSEQTHYDVLLAAKAVDREECGFAHLNIDPASELSGVDQGHDAVGEHAAALLHLKLIQRQTGIPLRRDLLLIEGTWINGRGDWRLRRRVVKQPSAHHRDEGAPEQSR